jgi:hypothetical protein
MSKRTIALEALAIGALSIGAVVLVKSLVGTAHRKVHSVAESRDPHEYTVLYSAHGAEFRHPDSQGEEARKPYKTLSDALATARRFVAASRQISGKARVINIRTGEEVEI